MVTSGKLFTPVEARHRLEDLALKAGSLSELARRLGVTPQAVQHVTSGRRLPSGAMLRAIGLRRVVMFESLPKRRD